MPKMSKPTLSSSSPSAIPILMRLPDLRLSKTRHNPSGSSAETLPGAPVLDAPVEVAAEREPPAELNHEQVVESTASSDVAAVSEATVRQTELPAIEPTVSLPAEAQPAAVVDQEPVVDQELPQAVSSKADVTNALPADSAEPVAPAAARRQRALERQRRLVAEPPRPRTWWTTHLPVIAIGFLVALVLTIYAGRRNRAVHANDTQASMELPELNIDTGNSSDSVSPSMSEPEMVVADQPNEAASAIVEVKPTVKSPPLLSAKPKVTIPDEPKAATPNAVAAMESPRTTAKPSGNQSDIANPYVSARATEGVPAAAEMSPESAADYPSTEAAVYRPGGRMPQEARAPTYPQTSTPHLR
jgi:hypothetical protein